MRKSSRLFLWKRRNLLFLYLPIAALLLPSSAFSIQDPAHSQGWVVIPVDEYRSLHAKAFPAQHEPETTPVEATLTRVDYDLQIAGDLATGRASLTVDVLKDGWVHVPVPSGLLVREARLNGKLVSLVPSPPGKGGDRLSAVLSHPGRSLLLMDIAVPVGSSAGTESITLPSSGSGITRASVQLPRQGVDVKLTGGLLQEKTESQAASKWLAFGHGNEPLTFTWKRKTEDHRINQPLRLRGALTQLLGLGEDSTSVYAEVNIEVTQGAARELKVQLPEKVTINQVMGAMVADWVIKAGELVVTFLEPVEQNARFVITGETHLPREGKIEVPLLRLRTVERETGGVAVEVLGAGEIKDLKPQGLDRADATDLGEMVSGHQSPSLAAFRLRSGDANTTRSLAVEVARYAPQAVLMANIEEARYQVLTSNQGKTLVDARYAVRNNQRNFVKITLPPGAVLWSTLLSGKPVRPGQASDGSLLLPLAKAHAGEEAPVFVLEVLYLDRGSAWDEKGKARIALPALDLPVSRTGLLVYYPPLFKVTAESGPFRAQAYENPFSAVLGPKEAEEPASPSGAPVFAQKANKGDATQALLDDYRTKSQPGRASGILPLRVSFPAFGPSIFLVSELTGENQAPFAELTYQKEKKGGAR
ncbi:MAG TPA: hypothetical protein VKZ53_16815 [Candidatus Angelobacter sp.]|nr:hypothetical protein [Candidatus Angelobacter sp.]